VLISFETEIGTILFVHGTYDIFPVLSPVITKLRAPYDDLEPPSPRGHGSGACPRSAQMDALSASALPISRPRVAGRARLVKILLFPPYVVGSNQFVGLSADEHYQILRFSKFTNRCLNLEGNDLEFLESVIVLSRAFNGSIDVCHHANGGMLYGCICV
jgi:hypothetical protein